MKCTYTISTSDRVLIGTSGVFTIQAKDSFGNNRTSGGEGFAVDLINTKASVIYSGVPFDGDNGIYLFPFRLETDGTYNINITYKGINIFGQNQFVVLKGTIIVNWNLFCFVLSLYIIIWLLVHIFKTKVRGCELHISLND